MNKKLISTLLLLFATLLSVQSIAQENTKKAFTPQHEFNLSIGAFNTLPYPAFDGYYANNYWSSGEFSSYNYERLLYPYDKSVTTGAISAGYTYSVLRWLSVGATFSYAGVFHTQYDNITHQEVGNRNSHNFMLMPTVRFTYLNHSFVRLYSQVGLGLGLSRNNNFNNTSIYDHRKDYNDNDWFVSGQMAFLGISLGRKLFGFSELGFGTKGAVIFGVGYKFNEKN